MRKRNLIGTLAVVFSLTMPFSSLAGNTSSISTLYEPIPAVEMNPVMEQGMMTSGGTYEKALKLFNEISNSDKGVSERIGSFTEARKLYECIGFEILDGRSSLKVFTLADGGYEIRWQSGAETMRQHELASAWIEDIWSAHAESIMALQTEKERVVYIAENILKSVISGYDKSYSNFAISDMVESLNYRATCGVYAMVMDRICEKAGISSFIEVGYCKGVPHAWNKIVYSDGSIRMVDLDARSKTGQKAYLDMQVGEKPYRSYYVEFDFNKEWANIPTIGYSL